MGYNNLQNILFSNSSVPNFLAWGSGISAQMAAIGWLQTTDTGQIVWTASVVAISNAVGDGTTTTYTYTLTSGPVLRVGMSIVVTGCTTGAFNQTKTITALGAGTFSVLSTANHASEGESGTGTVTAQAAVPTTNTGLYEIWQMGDGGTAIYLRLTFGNNSGNILIAIGIGTGVNGSGTLTGNTYNVDAAINWFTNAANDTVATDCYFCGASDRLSFMFRTPRTGAIVIERTKNSDGSNNNDGVMYSMVASSGGGFASAVVVFGVGVSNAGAVGSHTIVSYTTPGTVSLFNNSIAIKPVFPVYGKIGYPITGQMTMVATEATEGAFVTTTLYGVTHTYICSKLANFGNNDATLIRFD